MAVVWGAFLARVMHNLAYVTSQYKTKLSNNVNATSNLVACQ
jgi:hypothetical protein